MWQEEVISRWFEGHDRLGGVRIDGVGGADDATGEEASTTALQTPPLHPTSQQSVCKLFRRANTS